jgi:hypothetical protein
MIKAFPTILRFLVYPIWAGRSLEINASKKGRHVSKAIVIFLEKLPEFLGEYWKYLYVEAKMTY